MTKLFFEHDAVVRRSSIFAAALVLLAACKPAPPSSAPARVHALLNEACKPDLLPEAIAVNFQNEAFTPPDGYRADFGSGYTNHESTVGPPLAYGWVVPGSNMPLNLVGNGRDRGHGPSALQKTLMHMQGSDVAARLGRFKGVAEEGAWEVGVPAGLYDVTVGVGDPEYFDSVHGVRAEGQVVIANFIPSPAARFATATARVEAFDGRLTLVATGTNTKVTHVIITPVPLPLDCTIQVNFANAATLPPEGFVHDFGEAFGPRAGESQGTNLEFGWMALATGAPVDLSVKGTTPGNGRRRTEPSDLRLATLVHMQGANLAATDGTFNGKAVDAAWEIAVPAGWYRVTASVGDSAYLNSRHRLRVEGVVAIEGFEPSASQKFAEATVTVEVVDGRLTVDPVGGANTKLNYLVIDAVPAARPRVSGSTPVGGATAVVRDTPVIFDVVLPTVGNGVDETTLSPDNIVLESAVDGSRVAFTANTSAGGDIIVLQPVGLLAANTSYRISVTQGVRDRAGASFEPFELQFTTGSDSSRTGGDVAFEKVGLETASGALFTSVVIGPDDKLYAGTLTGEIWRFLRAADGTTGPAEILTSLVIASGGARAIIGLAFAPGTPAEAPVLWVSHGAPTLKNAPDWSGKISRLSGNALTTVDDIVVSLPRSHGDHMTNSIAFGPDGALYILQGSNSAMGAPDSNWRFRPERLLTAALLRLAPELIATLPLDAKTEEGGTYDPRAPGAPLTIYASGIRNAYDLLFHSNGHLYIPTNGSATPGNTPGTPLQLPEACARRADGPYNGPQIPPIIGVSKAQADYLFRVVAGGYYGHPNPARCEWVMNGGNPSAAPDPAEVDQYPVGTLPDPNWRGAAYDFGLHPSANGIIEYRSDVFGTRLQGKLLVARYSAGKDIMALTPAPTGDVVSAETGIAGFTDLASPLDLVEDPVTGYIYVTELAGQRITLLRPTEGRRIAISASALFFRNVVQQTVSPGQTVILTNTGGAPLTVTSVQLSEGGAYRVSHPALPLVLAPGQEASLEVVFAPNAAGPVHARLQISSNDPRSPVTEVALAGLGTLGVGGQREPSLQWILNTLRIPVEVGDPDPADNSLPANGLLGEEVLAPVFEKVGMAPVSIEMLAGFGPQSRDPAIHVGWYAASSAATHNALVTVSAAEAQSLRPAVEGITTFDPGPARFGFYSMWPSFDGRLIYSEDQLSPSTADISHHVRIYPLKESSGTVVPDAYVVAHEESIAGIFDYQDVVFIVRNVRPAVVSGASLRVQNLDAVPFDDRMAMNRIGSLAKPPSNRVHDRSVVRFHNDGFAALTVSALTAAGPFVLEDAPGLPFALGPGAHRDVTVRFAAFNNGTANGYHQGSLTIDSDDPSHPSRQVELGGFWQSVSEGGQEPNLLEIARVFGYKTTIAGPGQKLDGKGRVQAIGDEVLSPYWRRADVAAPVTVRQLAAFHTQGNTATVRWHPSGSASLNKIFTHAGIDGQSFLPLESGSSAPASGSFSPGGEFGFKIDGEWSDAARNNQAPDRANGCVGACGHHVRFWPLKDRSGGDMPNQYLMVMDYSGINYDYNDNVYLVTNIEPAAD